MNEVLDDLMMKIMLFLFRDERNTWIYFDYGMLYVRKSKRIYKGNFIECFDIASVEIYEEFRGMGFFKTLLDTFIESYPDKNIYVESILNAKFYVFLKNYGFKPLNVDDEMNLILVR